MRKNLVTLATAALATWAASGLSPAHAVNLYGTLYSGTTPLYQMNQANGSAVTGPSTGQSGITDLASSGTNSSVWGVVSSSNTLYRYDVTTGAVTATVPITGSLAPTGAPENIVSIAFDTRLNVMYGSTAVSFGGFNDLFSINLSTGAATLIGNLQIDKMYALAYNPADGFLYGANGEIGESSTLWKISTANASATAVGALSTTGNFDLAFRPGDNVLFLASTATNSLYTVNPATAAETLLGAYGNGNPNIAGLAFAVPEPHTWALMAGGLLLVGRRIRASQVRER